MFTEEKTVTHDLVAKLPNVHINKPTRKKWLVISCNVGIHWEHFSYRLKPPSYSSVLLAEYRTNKIKVPGPESHNPD